MLRLEPRPGASRLWTYASPLLAIALTVVTAFSSMIISSLRKKIPSNIRIIVELAIIASLVIVTDQNLGAMAGLFVSGHL